MALSQGKTVDTNALTVGLATIKISGVEVGSVTDGTLEVTLETLEHKTGLPLTTDKKVVIEKGARFVATWEEVRLENLRQALGVPSSEITTISGTTATGTNVTQGMTNLDWAGIGHTNLDTSDVPKVYPGALTAANSTTTKIYTAEVHNIVTNDLVTIVGVSGTHTVTNASGASKWFTIAALSSAPSVDTEVYATETTTAASTEFTENTDYVIDYSIGRVRRISAGSISSGARVYVTYTYASAAGGRIPLGTSTAPIEVPVEIVHSRPDQNTVSIKFWKASPGGTFSLPFSPTDWVGYAVELTSLYDNNHPNDPLGYIELPS